jgi:Leucine Rich repeat
MAIFRFRWVGLASPARRGALAALLVLCMAPIGCTGGHDPATDRALDEILSRGGRFERDRDAEGEPVVKLDLTGSPVTDADLVTFKPLTRLNSLILRGTRVTDAGMARLTSTGKLRNLDLGKSAVTDNGLTHVGRLTSLRSLSLDATAVTDAGLELLAPLTKLWALDLRHTEVTDAGLVHLRGLPKLRVLKVEGTRVTDAGIARLRKESPQVRVVTGSHGQPQRRTF